MFRPVYTIHGEILSHNQMVKRNSGFEIERCVDCRTMVSLYPQLQEFDVTIGMDVLELRNQLIQELFPPDCSMEQPVGPQL